MRKGIETIIMMKFFRFLRSMLIQILILPIRLYQLAISPLMPASCRHLPTCSQYAIEALKVHGIFKGSWLAFRRIIRCHPWGTQGFDPVPPKKIKTKRYS
jgi:putative membrane protein insertion efficiency factor